jgi:hypothetical protein
MTIKGLKRPEPRLDISDDEARYSRHEERELDRRHQRDRARLCLPFEDWPVDYQRDLEDEAEKATRLQLAENQSVVWVAGQVNPFWPTDAVSQEPA